jgi:hypothetical protein
MARATRNDECTINRSNTSYVLYLAFELGVDEWKLGFTKDLGTRPRVRVMPARDLRRLAREIAAAKQWFALSEITPVRSCYEAGRDGFWLHRHLATVGIDNRVVDSSSIEVKRRQRVRCQLVIMGHLLHEVDVLAGQFFGEMIQEGHDRRIGSRARGRILIRLHRRGCCPTAHGGHWNALL